MSFTEWSNAKKKKREESSTQPSPSVAVKPTASGKTGSGGSYNSFAEWSDARKKERATQSAQDWADAANALLKDTQSYFGSWRSKDDDGYNSIQERNSALLAQADSWRKQYAGNDEVISYIDSVVEALSNDRQGSRGYLDFYSQWDSEDSYKKWMQHSTPEGRQEQYEKNKARLEELEKKQRESRNYQPGVSPYLSGGSATSGSPYAASQQDPKVGQSDIKKEIEQIRKEILLYERGGTDETGFYYGFKASDDYGKLKSNADYGTKSANRGFQNPSREDLLKGDTLNDSSSWYTDADGVYRDAFGNELKTDASGNWVNPNAQGYAVVDRLGLYLSASEEEKQEAVSVPVSMEGTWESVIKDGYDGNWELLDKDEVDIYYYLLNTSGQETADKYLSDMKVELNRRNAQNATVRYTEAFDEANALERLAMSIASTPAQLFSGAAGFIEDTAMTMMGKDINPYSAAHGGMNYSNTVRSEQAKAFDDATGGIAIPFIDFTVGDLYQAGMSAFDMYVGGRLGAGAYEALMGMGAASSEAKRLYEQGASNSQIVWGGALAGAAEMVFEHASIENLINMKDADTVGQMVKNILVQGGIEASEEGFTEIANTITNAIVMGDASDWAKLLVEHDGDYLAALIAKAKEVGHSAFSGFVSGSVGGGAQSTASYAQTQAQNKDLGQYISGAGSTDALMALAQEMAGATSGKDQKRLTSQSERIKKDEFLTKGGKQRATGRLYSTVRSVVTEQNISEISSALQEKGFSKKDATAIAGAVAVQASGIELSDKQQKTLQKYESNETVQAVLDEVLGNEESGINQRAKSIAKFEFDTMRSHIASQIKQAVASQENAESDDTVDSLEEDGTEGNYEASADGKTILKSNSKIVNIQEVADIRDGKMTLKLDDGSTVDAEDVIYGSEGEALVYETIAQMGASVRAASILVDGFKATQGMDARVYAQGIEEAFRYGKQGIPARKLATSIFASKLNPGQQEYVYRQGKKAAGKQVAKEQATVLKNRTVAENATTVKDSRSYKAVLEDGVSASSLNESQKASYRLADQIAEAAQVNIRVYAGKTGEHGYYDPKTDEIYLNLNATNQSRKSMMAFTLGHELVHRAKKGSPAKYKAFANFLMEQYGKQDSDIDAMIGEELAAAKRFKIQMTYDQAFEEVVCDACERMLLDTDAGQKLAEFGAQSKQNKSFLEDLKRWITEFLDKLRSIFEGVEPNSMAAKEFAKFDASVKQILADMYVDMTIDAGENLSVIQNAFGKGTVVETNEQGEFTMANSKDGAKKVFNLVTWENGGRETMEATLLSEGYTEEEVKAALTIMDGKHNLVKELEKQFPEQSRINQATITTDLKDGHSVLSALVSNGDYPVNIDLLMVCKKRKAYQRVINRLCETGMIQQATVDALAIAEINKILGKYGFETACLGCFVESRRLRIQEWAQTICKEWNAEVKKRNPNAKAFGFGKGEAKLTQDEVMKLIGELESGGEKNDQGNLNLGQGSAVKRMGVLLDKVPSLRKTLSIEDLITPDGLSSLRRFDSNLFSMVKSRYGSNSPKFVQEFNPYNHEIAKYGKVPSEYNSLREYLYAIGGARMQSFSDFIVENWFDYCQIVADLAARKLPMHTYTKEITLAKLLGMTGIKINMSLIPDIDRSLGKDFAGLTRNEKGELELIWADKDRFKKTGGKSYMQSINFADAMALQEDSRYSANVGTIAIGVSDKQILMMLDDSRIRMVIPYHSSGMNPIFADLMGTSFYKDYTMVQNTMVKQIYNSKGQKVTLKLDKTQTGKLTSGFQFNEVLQELGDARAAVQAYKEWCADATKHSITIKGETYTAELTPKFDDFSGHENYYKLLEDFNTYDCISEQAAPQGDVQQIYPEDFNKILEAELNAQEGHRQKQAANQAFDKAMGEIEAYLQNHTKADTVFYAEQHGVKLSAKDKKLGASDKEKLKKLREEGASFSLPKTDSDGKQLSEDQQEFFKNSVVRDVDGNLMVMYHGTANGGAFTVFDGDQLGNEARTSQVGQGFYFTNIKNEAESYMKNVDIYGRVSRGSNPHLHQVYLNITNPFDISADQLDMNKVKAVYMDGTDDYFFSNWIPFYLNRKTVNGRIFTKAEVQGMSKSEKVSAYVDYLAELGTKEVLSNMVRAFPYGKQSELLASMKKQLGYDGIVEEYAPGKYQYVAFSSEQIKATNNQKPTTDPDIRYSLPKGEPAYQEWDVQAALYDAMDHADNGEDNLIRVGEMPRYITEKIGIEGDFYIYRNHAYENMVSREQAIKDGRPVTRKGENIHFHDLGVDTMTEAILSLENPTMTIATKTKDGNPAVIMILPVKGKNKAPLYAVLSFYSNRKINGEPGRKPHVVLTIAEREFFGSKGRGGYAEIVGNAVKDGRVIDFNKKMRDDLSVIANPAGVGDITDASLTANLSHFRKEIKLFREKNHINYKLPVGEDTSPRALLANALESVAQNDMERKKLQEYKSKIDLINAEEKKLRSLTWQMAKETDPKKVRELQFEAMHTTNRINTYDRQLLRLEASKPLQDVLAREKKMAYDRGIQKGKDALEAYKKRTEEKQQEIIDRYQESRKRGVENRQKTAMRQKIRKVIRDLDKILNRGDKKKNVKEDMKDFVADALATADVLFTDNYRNEDMVWYGVSTDMTPEETKLMSEARAIMEEISNLPTGYEGWQARQEKEEKLKSRLNYRMAKLRDVFVRERARLNKMQVSEVLGNLADSYAKLQTSEYAHIQGAYQEAVYQYLLMLKEDVGGTIVKDMSLGQLEELYKAYTMVMTTVRNANRMFAENLNNTRDTLANMVMYEVHKAGGEHGLWTKAGDKINTFSWNNEKPVYAFERIGSNTFTKLFNNIRKGQDSWAVDLQEANNFRRAIYEKYNHGTWDMDKQYKFTSASGINFELNLEQIMSLYAYSKRAQAHDHLLKGGFVFDGNTEVVVTKNGIKRTYLNKNATAYNVSFEILEGIISKLTAEQKGFVDEMQDYLSTTMGEKGNEISMQLYGVKLFNEKFYFPLRSAGQYMEKAKEADLKKEQGQISIVNSGFAKATKVKASNPVVLAGFMDVWADHVNEMSMYHSFVLPMEDFRRVYNYSSPHMEGQPSASVNGVIQNAYGAAATDYIDKLYRDLNGGAITDNTTGVINKLMNLFKKGAVFASASVVVQQPSAIARATALVDTKHFIGPKVDAKRHKALWAEVKQYAPVAIIKEMGYFDTNMGKSAVDYLTGEEYSGIKEKAIALVKDESYRDELLSKAPSLADELTWCAIWEAVKRETKERNKNMDVRSEEFLRLAGERFSEVIDKTQVYDSVLARSANMRSKDTGMKMATAFMSEPTTSINMVADALRKGKKGDKKYARRAIGSVVASVVLNSFLVAFVQAARDDDEDESITEKYLSAFVSGIADGVNPATYIPFIKDIVSIVQGYDVERSDMAVISDLWNAYQNLGKDSVSAWRKVEGFAGSIAQIFGLPLKNIMRDLRSLYQAYDTIVNGEKTTMGGIKYATKEALTGKSTSNMDQLYESKVAGDEAHAARVAARYEDADSADAAVREAIKNRFLEDELDFFNAQRELVLHAHMDAGDVRWLMDRWEYIKEHGSDEGYSKYNDFYEAVETGKNLKAVIKEYNDSGTDMKTLKSQITKHFKPIYMEMTTAERASIKGYLLNAYEQCGDEREYAEWMLESFVWESQGYGEVTVAAVRDYYSYCADAGVSRDVYLHIREFSNNTENDVDENGKTINYSAVKKIMAEIHSLPITNDQKTAIALTLWKESTVKKYKLW